MNPPSLGTWFRLKDPARAGFEIDPASDAQLWCGPEAERSNLLTALLDGLSHSAPKLIFYGEYGTGKTHALHHCQYVLYNNPLWKGRVHCVRVDWSGFTRRTRFSDLYRETMRAIGQDLVAKLIRMHFAASPPTKLEGDLAEMLHTDQDLNRVLDAMHNGAGFWTGSRTELFAYAWRWLTCLSVTQSQRNRLNVAATLLEEASPTRLVKLLRLWGRLLRIYEDKRLIILFDEAEQADVLRRNSDASNSFTSAIRGLYDREQSDIGVLLAFFGDTLHENGLVRPDTDSRIDHGRQVFAFGPLSTPAKRLEFLDRVLTSLGTVPLPYPFDSAARVFFAEQCESFLIGFDDEVSRLMTRRGELTPRAVLMALDAVTRAAHRDGVQEITVPFMKKLFPRSAAT